MPTTSITPDQDAVVSEIEIAAPPGRIFQALTDGGQLMRWFTSTECPVKFWEMDPRLGGRYRYATEKGTVAVNGETVSDNPSENTSSAGSTSPTSDTDVP